MSPTEKESTVRLVVLLLAFSLLGFCSRRASFKQTTSSLEIPMSFLRNTDVKKHLGRNVPRFGSNSPTAPEAELPTTTSTGGTVPAAMSNTTQETTKAESV
jgi:hypothetical protein